MNKILLLLNLVLLSSCNGQTNNTTESYSQKVEYGLKGNVKEMREYVCKVEHNKIPLDSINFSYKYIKTFDQQGNSIENNSLLKNGKDTLHTNQVFSGKGKDISYIETDLFNNRKIHIADYKLVWLDDFTYKIIDANDENHIEIIKLNKKFQIAENTTKKDDFELKQKIEKITKNNKIEKIKNIITTKTNGKRDTSYLIEVTKEYDKFDNPSIIYLYKTLDEKLISDVIFKEYIYY